MYLTYVFFFAAVMDIYDVILMVTVVCNILMCYPQIIKLLCTRSANGVNAKMFLFGIVSGVLQLTNFCFNKPLLLQWVSCVNGIVCNTIIFLLCLIYGDHGDGAPSNDNYDSLISVGSVLLYTQPATAIETSTELRTYITFVSGYTSLFIVLIGRIYQLRNHTQNLSIIFLVLAIIANGSYIISIILKYALEHNTDWLYSMLYLLIGNSVELVMHIYLFIRTMWK